jgi:hypothetical protein
MTTVTEIMRLAEQYDLPEEVVEQILKQVYRWPQPKVDDQGYVISKVKNIHKCPVDLVLENVVNRPRWQHIARVPALHAYERRVCMWKPEYYDVKNDITGITKWVGEGGVCGHRHGAHYNPVWGVGWTLLSDVDRRSDEWIGFRSWVQTHPAFISQDFRWERKTAKVLSNHWFKYELALAYPTLYGKNGWAKKKTRSLPRR